MAENEQAAMITEVCRRARGRDCVLCRAVIESRDAVRFLLLSLQPPRRTLWAAWVERSFAPHFEEAVRRLSGGGLLVGGCDAAARGGPKLVWIASRGRAEVLGSCGRPLVEASAGLVIRRGVLRTATIRPERLVLAARPYAARVSLSASSGDAELVLVARWQPMTALAGDPWGLDVVWAERLGGVLAETAGVPLERVDTG